MRCRVIAKTEERVTETWAAAKIPRPAGPALRGQDIGLQESARLERVNGLSQFAEPLTAILGHQPKASTDSALRVS
mgnify:CR=1 FL=1